MIKLSLFSVSSSGQTSINLLRCLCVYFNIVSQFLNNDINQLNRQLRYLLKIAILKLNIKNMQFLFIFFVFINLFSLIHIYLILIYCNLKQQTALKQKLKMSMKKNEKNHKKDTSYQPKKDKTTEDNRCFQNLLYPNMRVHCDDCKREITKNSRVLANQLDYCISCFTNLDDYPRIYQTICKLDFALFDSKWSAEDELLLFEGLEKHGFGNWGQIAQFISNGKTPEQIQSHYLTTYLEAPNFLPKNELLTRRDSQGKLIKPYKDQVSKKISKGNNKNNNSNKPTSFQKASLTINSFSTQIKSGSNPAQIVGFMPKRGDFEVEYDNDAQLLLAELQFNEDDVEQQKAMKFRIIDIYNQKLTERIRRKQFVLSRNLLDLKEQTRLQKNRNKQEKQMHNMMKIFARFNSAQDHQKLIQGILAEKQLRRRIEQLKQYKSKGYRNLSEIQSQDKPKKVDKNKQNNSGKLNSIKQTQNKKLKSESLKQKQLIKQDVFTKQEEELCSKFRLPLKTYFLIRQTMIRESVRKGVIDKPQAYKIFKMQKNVIDCIFDLLVENDEINVD